MEWPGSAGRSPGPAGFQSKNTAEVMMQVLLSVSLLISGIPKQSVC